MPDLWCHVTVICRHYFNWASMAFNIVNNILLEILNLLGLCDIILLKFLSSSAIFSSFSSISWLLSTDGPRVILDSFSFHLTHCLREILFTPIVPIVLFITNSFSLSLSLSLIPPTPLYFYFHLHWSVISSNKYSLTLMPHQVPCQALWPELQTHTTTWISLSVSQRHLKFKVSTTKHIAPQSSRHVPHSAASDPETSIITHQGAWPGVPRHIWVLCRYPTCF